jgi:coenzyme F420 hydrogenase subunit beta
MFIKMREMGDMWGSGLFKANACDFCDDVTTELADISLGDAWLEPYDKDGKGTSVILTRSNISHQIIIEGIKNKKLNVDPLSLEKFLHSQRGSFSHRQDSIHYRIKKAKRMTPPKRIIDHKPISLDFKIVQLFRMITRKKSLSIWSNHPSHKAFNRKMKGFMFSLKIATLIYHFKRSLDNGNLLIKIKNKYWKKN